MRIAYIKNRDDIIKHYMNNIETTSKYYIHQYFPIMDIKAIKSWYATNVSTDKVTLCNIYIDNEIDIDELLKHGLVPVLYFEGPDRFLELSDALDYIEYPDELIKY